MLKNISAPFSINKFYNAIKSQGHKAGRDTLYSYLSYLEDPFLIFYEIDFITQDVQGKYEMIQVVWGTEGGSKDTGTRQKSPRTGRERVGLSRKTFGLHSVSEIVSECCWLKISVAQQRVKKHEGEIEALISV